VGSFVGTQMGDSESEIQEVLRTRCEDRTEIEKLADAVSSNYSRNAGIAKLVTA